MKNISEIDISRYSSYFLTEEIGDVVLKFNTSNGLIDIDAGDYDTFSTEAGTLIGFKKLHQGIFNYVYLSGSDRGYFQNLSYESFQENFNMPKGESWVVYTFLNSVVIPEKGDNSLAYRFLPDDFVRCDYGVLGVRPFYFLQNRLSIKRVVSLMDVAGVGHILCTFTDDIENPNKDSQGINANAGTLAGTLKTIYEWSEAYKSPFNNQEPIAKAAHDFLNEIGIPENVLTDIINSQDDMRVARYIKGETRSSYVLDENTATPESLRLFMNSRCRYRSLYQLINNHPRRNELTDSVFVNHIDEVESLLYQIYLENDLETFTTEYMQEYFTLNQNRHSYTALRLLSLLKEME